MATSADTRPAWDTGVGRRAVDGGWVISLTLLFIAMSVLLLYAALAVWPPALPPAGTSPATGAAEPMTSPVIFGVTIAMSREQNLLLLVAVLGGLGAMAHVLRSFFKYVGERQLLWSWVAQYVLIPFVGALLATITYILLRAGLISGGGVQEGNIWGFAAVATLVGLFTSQAMTKLKEVFEAIFASSPAGGESIDTTNDGPSPIQFSPQKGRAGSEVALTGVGLENATAVVFGGGVSSDASWDATSGSLNTKVPAGATAGPLKVTVTRDLVRTDVISKDTFTVL